MYNLCRVHHKDVALWIMAQPGGVTCRDVAAKFNVNPKKASCILCDLRIRDCYVTRWEEGSGFPNSANCKPGRLFIDAINEPVYSRKPVGPVVAIHIETGEVTHFMSVPDAVARGGFTDVCVYKTVHGKNKHHAGYRFMRLEDYEQSLKGE